MGAIGKAFLLKVGGIFSLPPGIPIPDCGISSLMPILVNSCLRDNPAEDRFEEEEADREVLEATVSKLE